MTSSPAQTSPSPSGSDRPPQQSEFVVRTAPKIGGFLLAGAVAGAFIALVVTVVGQENPEFTFGTTFGFFLVLLLIPGIAVGALAWWVLDRVSRRRAYTVHVRSVQDPEQADLALRGHDVQQWRDRWENEDNDTGDSQAR